MNNILISHIWYSPSTSKSIQSRLVMRKYRSSNSNLRGRSVVFWLLRFWVGNCVFKVNCFSRDWLHLLQRRSAEECCLLRVKSKRIHRCSRACENVVISLMIVRPMYAFKWSNVINRWMPLFENRLANWVKCCAWICKWFHNFLSSI